MVTMTAENVFGAAFPVILSKCLQKRMVELAFLVEYRKDSVINALMSILLQEARIPQIIVTKD